uniref:Uncharacterized protein n=1 Tax=Helianthus annuus TaxID=4232 RepID=A0A251VCN6_HELAN
MMDKIITGTYEWDLGLPRFQENMLHYSARAWLVLPLWKSWEASMICGLFDC